MANPKSGAFYNEGILQFLLEFHIWILDMSNFWGLIWKYDSKIDSRFYFYMWPKLYFGVEIWMSNQKFKVRQDFILELKCVTTQYVYVKFTLQITLELRISSTKAETI